MISGAITASSGERVPGRMPARRLAIALVVFIAIAVSVRAWLPYWLTGWVNDRIDTMGAYHGRVADIDLTIIKGAVVVEGVLVEKREGEVPVPFLDISSLDVGISWRELLNGQVVATVELTDPQVNFVDLRSAEDQDGSGVEWRTRLEQMLPIRLDEFRVTGGRVHFRNFYSEPPVDVAMTEVEITVNNLSSRPDNDSKRSSNYTLSGKLTDHGAVDSGGSFAPLSPLEDFEIYLKLGDINLVKLNDFLGAYANVDAENGEGDFVLELAARDGQLTGYAKPIFREVQLFSWERDVEKQDDSPLRVLWESFAGFVENVFKNDSENQTATKVEIKGRIDSADISTWEAIRGVIVNAFVDAYQPVLDGLPARDTGD